MKYTLAILVLVAAFGMQFAGAQTPADGAHTHPGLESRIAAVESRLTALERTPTPTPSATAVPTSSATPAPTASPTPSPTATPAPSPTPVPASGTFTVSGNRILDPTGARFIVKGMTPIYGPFAGGDANGTWSTYSLNNSLAIFTNLKTQWNGVNTVRIFTSAGAAQGHQPDWAVANYRTQLWSVVANARSQGLVVLLVNSYSNVTDTNAWITELALRYKGDPYVWLTPSNEPFCTSPDAAEKSHCYDWAYWQTQTQTQVSLIRGQGNHSPILLNGLDWSWDWRSYASNPVADPDNRLVFGAHRYACSDVCKSWTAAEIADANVKWANLATTMPIVVDEIGNWNNGGNSVTWYQGATDFLASWVNVRGGAGAIAFNHYWSDANGMTTNGVTRNAWGTYWRDHYLGIAR